MAFDGELSDLELGEEDGEDDLEELMAAAAEQEDDDEFNAILDSNFLLLNRDEKQGSVVESLVEGEDGSPISNSMSPERSHSTNDFSTQRAELKHLNSSGQVIPSLLPSSPPSVQQTPLFSEKAESYGDASPLQAPLSPSSFSPMDSPKRSSRVIEEEAEIFSASNEINRGRGSLEFLSRIEANGLVRERGPSLSPQLSPQLSPILAPGIRHEDIASLSPPSSPVRSHPSLPLMASFTPIRTPGREFFSEKSHPSPSPAFSAPSPESPSSSTTSLPSTPSQHTTIAATQSKVLHSPAQPIASSYVAFKRFIGSLSRVRKSLVERKNGRVQVSATCVGAGDIIAVGWSDGHVSVIDHRGQEVQAIPCAAGVEKAVGAIDVQRTGDPWIAVGYENGHIAIFDWTTGNEVKTIVDANSSPLTHLSFSTANTVLAMDSGGQLFRISITKMFFIFSAEVEKIATIRGSGPISTCAALPEGVKPHPSDFFSLVAFGTYRRVMISSLHPRMEMKHTVEAPAHGMEEVMKKKGAGAEAARPSTLSQSKSKLRLRCFPHISWRPARPTTDSNGKMEDPILAIGWGNQVQLLKAVVVNSLGKNAGRTSMGMREVSKTTATSRGGTSKGVVQHQEEEGGEDIAFENISFFFTSDESVAKCYICGVRWLSPQVLLVVNSRKELQLWDPFGGGKLDLFDFTFMRVAGMNLVLLPSAKKTLGGEEEEEFAKTKANLSLRIDMSVQTSYTATTDNEDDEENIEDDAEDNVDSDVDDVREAPESNLDRAIRISYEPHIAVCKGRVYVLGEKTMYCGHLLRWQERVEALQTANNFEGALALLLALHEGSANALISRTAGAQARLRHRTAEYMEGMLRESVASVLNARPKHEKILQIVQQLVHYSKAIDRPQLITVFFNEFVKKHQSDVFLEAIVPLILKKKLEALSPEVMKALIIYFEQKEDFDALESCICNLDYTTLDIDATVRLCRQFHLPTALTYVYTNVMQDFIGPIETFLPLLIRTRDRLNMNKSENSNHNPYPASVLKQRIAAAGPFVLQYIKVTLDGATLSGELMEEKRQEVARTQVLQYLFTKKELATSSSSLTSPSPSLGSSLSNREIQLHFDAKGSAVSSYQALRVLLAYDTSGCLDALSPAFNNPSLSDTAVPFATDVVDSQSSEISSSSPSLEGLTPEVSSSGYSSAASDGSLPPEFQKRRGRRGRGSTSRGGERSRKREKKPSSVSVGHTAMVAALVSILFDVGVEPYHVESFKLRVAQQVEEEEQEMRKGIQPKSFDCKFTMAQEASLHHYLARYYNAGVIPLPDEVLKYSFGFLCCVDYDHGSRMSLKEREESMLLLIQSCPLDRLMSDRLLAIVEKAKFYRVLKMLYVFARQFGRAIQAHLVATNSNSSIFLFLRELLAKFDKGQEGPKLREEVLKFVSDLLAINSEQASQLLVTYFLSEHRRVMDQLQNKPRLQYDYLRLVERSTEISEQEHELLIRLMCEYDPARVYDHLASHDEYRPLICLEIVSKYNLPDSKAYLLEKTGDYTAALEILTESLSDCLEKVKLCCKDVDSSSSFTPLSLMEKRTLSEQSNTESDSIVLASNVLHLKQAVEDCVAASKKCENLCKRASIKFGFEEDDNYSMWFKFLDTLLESMVSCREWIRHPPYVSRYGQLVISSIAGLTKAALAGAMSAGVMPARLLQNVIAGYGADTQLTHFADVISSMFENYKYELSILETTNRLLETDTHFATKFLLSNRQKAFVVQPKDRFCAVCEQPFQEAVPVDLRMKWKCHASENADSTGGSQFTTTVQDDSGAGMWHKRNEDEERGVVMRCFSKCGHVVHPSCMFVSSSTANIPCPACTVSARTSSASLVESNHKSKFSRLAPSVPTQLAMERLSGYEEKSKYVREEEVRHLRYVFG